MRKYLLLSLLSAATVLAALQGVGSQSPAVAPPHAEGDAAAAATATGEPETVVTETTDGGTEPDAPGSDILAEALEVNSERYPAPPEPTRRGHVSRRSLAAGALERKDGGFEVRLPSGAMIATPTVYGGKVLVSGGFRSREYYAFDAETGKTAWAIGLDDDGPSTAACDGGVCAFNTESCTLFTVDAETGELLWAWWLGDPLMSAPTIAGGKVFTTYPVMGSPQTTDAPITSQVPAQPVGADHALAAFELRTGKVVWQKWIDGDAISAPVASGEEIVVATFGGTVYRFSQQEGRILAARRERATSAPTVDGDEIYFSKRLDGAGEAAAEGLSASRLGGATRWLAERKRAAYLDSEIQARSKMWADGLQLDAGNGFGGGAPAAAKAGEALANVGQGSVSTLQAFQGSRIVKAGEWTYSTMGEEVICASAADGKRKWAHKLTGDLRAEGGALAAPPVPVGDNLLVATLSGELLLLDRARGEERGRFSLGHPIRSQPVAVGGWIYAGTQDGRLVALNTGDPSITGWPMWGGDAGRNG